MVRSSKRGSTLSTGYAPPVLAAPLRRDPLGPDFRGRYPSIERAFGAIRLLALFAVIFGFARSPVNAIEPVGELGAALAYGRSVTLDKLLLSPEWSTQCSDPDAAYAKVWTPFWKVAVYEARSHARYEDDAAARAELADERKRPSIDITYEVLSPDVDANTNPAIVALQDGRVIHPTTKVVGRPSAAMSSANFARDLTGHFALGMLNLHRPFTVVFADVDDREQNGTASEVRCKIDPSKIR